MNIFFILISLAILLNTLVYSQRAQSADIDEWTTLPIDTARNNPDIKNILNIGAQSVSTVATTKRALSNDNYIITEIYSIAQKQVADAVKYKFNVSISDSENNNITAQYVIYYQASTGNWDLMSYFFEDIILDNDKYGYIDAEWGWTEYNNEDYFNTVNEFGEVVEYSSYPEQDDGYEVIEILNDGYVELELLQAQNDINIQSLTLRALKI